MSKHLNLIKNHLKCQSLDGLARWVSIKWKELVSLVQLKLVSFVTVGRGDLNPISSFLLMLGLLKLFIKNGLKP